MKKYKKNIFGLILMAITILSFNFSSIIADGSGALVNGNFETG